MSTADPFATFDAAYVLGALSDEDRQAFEAHLRECDACAAAVHEMSDLPGMLAAAPASALDDEPPPASLLAGLQRRARRERNRRRWIASGIAAAAAACLVAVTVVLTRPDHVATHPVAMHAVTNAPITATADVRSVGWGTYIELVCRYDHTVYNSRRYALVVVDRHGNSQPLGSWKLVPGKVAKYESGTSLSREEISALQITSMDGTPLLKLAM